MELIEIDREKVMTDLSKCLATSQYRDCGGFVNTDVTMPRSLAKASLELLKQDEFLSWLAQAVMHEEDDGALGEIICRKMYEFGYIKINKKCLEGEL